MIRNRETGSTLIECMIVVAMLGITTLALTPSMSASSDVIRRERALQVLEQQASALMRGATPDPVTTARLMEVVPEGKLDVRRGNGTATITVAFALTSGRPDRRSLTVVTP